MISTKMHLVLQTVNSNLTQQADVDETYYSATNNGTVVLLLAIQSYIFKGAWPDKKNYPPRCHMKLDFDIRGNLIFFGLP